MKLKRETEGIPGAALKMLKVKAMSALGDQYTLTTKWFRQKNVEKRIGRTADAIRYLCNAFQTPNICILPAQLSIV